MYVNKFKCEKPSLTEFKNGVAFCSVCNKNVYDVNTFDLTELTHNKGDFCARVPAKKIISMQRSIIGATFVAAAIFTPIDVFSQGFTKLESSVYNYDTSAVVFSGIVRDEKNRKLEDVTVLLISSNRILTGCKSDKNGVFKLDVDKRRLLNGELSIEFRHGDYLVIRYDSISDEGFKGLLVNLQKVDDRFIDGMVTTAFKIPLIETSYQGTTLGPEDLKNIPR